MTTGSSNTFVLPSQGSTLVNSRDQFNNSLKALLRNFYSEGIPASDNIIEGTTSIAQADYNGVLYRSSNTGMLYISDTNIDATRTNNPVGGKFTRYGIAWRQQGSLAAAAANIAKFDLGEAFVVVNNTEGGNSANNRLYLRTRMTNTFSDDFIDVGRTPGGSAAFTGDLTVTDGTIAVTGSSASPRDIINTNTSTSGSAQSRFLAKTQGAAGWAFGQEYSTKNGLIYSSDASDLYISTNSTQRLRLSSAGAMTINAPGFSTFYTFTAAPSTFMSYRGNVMVASKAENGSNPRNNGLFIYEDNLFGVELGHTGANWSTRVVTRDTDGNIEFGKYPSASTTQVNHFTPWMTMNTSGNVGIAASNTIAKLVVGGHIRTTSGGVIYPDGTIQTTAAAINVQTFLTPGAATWTKPAGFSGSSRVLIQCWGGGGSGGCYYYGAGGGGGGSYTEIWRTLSSLGSTNGITVGAGGASRSTNLEGQTGGASYFDGIVGAAGGGGGGGAGYYNGGGGGASWNAGGLPSVNGGIGGYPGGADGAVAGSLALPAFLPGGGGGGGGAYSTGGAGDGGGAIMGGGGGGGSWYTYGVVGVGGGGIGGGLGGNGGVGGTSGGAGAQPGGGGGGGCNGSASGAGGAGAVIVTVFPA